MLLLPTAGQEQQRDGPAPDAAEALIREARRRTRRRRVGAAAAVLLAAVSAGLYALLVSGGPGVIAGTADSPYANARAFNGHGELAFVSRDQLWVLDGAGGALRHLRVPAGYEAASPTFSRDGRWLAYVVQPTTTNYYGLDQLWLAHGDGAGAHRVRGLRLDELVGWSPRGDVLAVTAAQQFKHRPYGEATTVELVSPAGRPRALVDVGDSHLSSAGVDAATWSPTGSSVAAVLQSRNGAARIASFPVSGLGRPTVWFSAGTGTVHVAGLSGQALDGLVPQLAGWRSHWGIAFWVIGGGAVQNRDSTPLAVIPSPGRQPRYLTQTLSVGMSKAVAPGPGGKLALVASSQAGGREIGAGKTVETCAPGGMRCAAVSAATSWAGPNTQTPVCRRCGLPRPPVAGSVGSGVSLDPAWAPNGRLVAFVKAPVAETEGDPDPAWFADHAIYVWNAATDTTRRVGDVDGSAVPTWSGDGRDLLYESGDGLWLMPLTTGKPVEIVHPLYAQTAWSSKVSPLASVSFYGQIPWQSQFSWWSPAR